MKITREARRLLQDFLTPLPWYKDARCAQIGGDFWYPEKGESNKDAKTICLTCPAQGPCLQEALRTDDQFGVWGGLSEFERRGMKPGRAA